MQHNQFVAQHPALTIHLKNANHVDIKTAEGEMTLREFLAGALSYQPRWVTFLYGVRWLFVRLLGLKQEGIPHSPKLAPDDIAMRPGDKNLFFTVDDAEEEHYLITSIEENHLKASLAVVKEPLENGNSRFHTITIVHYNNWTGPVYFNVIRPFHHLVVGQMVRAGIHYKRS
jgi:hypothetical protein